MQIDIKEVIVIVRQHGTDKVVIHTNNLAPTVYPWDEPGSLVMDVAKDKGAQYVRDNLGVEPKVVGP